MNAIIESKIEPIDILDDGTVTDVVSFEYLSIPLKTFVERLATCYDTEVIFQRDPGWSVEMQANLIRSIMTGNPIGYCLLCEQPMNVANKNIIDFKNRALTVQNFWNSLFKIPLRLHKGDDYRIAFMTWKEMRDSNDPQLQNIVQKFMDYEIHCVVFKGMNLVQQSKKYTTVNTYLPLANEECLYGKYFWAKGFYRSVFEHCLQGLMKHTRAKQEAKNQKEKGTIFTQRICYTCFGAEFNDVWAVRNLGNSKSNSSDKPLIRDTAKLHLSLAGLIEQLKVLRLDVEFLKKTQHWDQIENLRKLCNLLADVLYSNNSTNKRLNKNDLFDIIVFFMKKVQDEKLTFIMLRDNKKVYYDLITTYIEEKSKDKTMTGQSVTTKKIQERLELFEKIWASLVADDGVKNKRPSATDISLAYLKSPSHCSLAGEALREGDAIVEHTLCKSKHSETDYTITSRTGNAWKAAVDPDQAKKLDSFYDEKLK